MVLDWKNNPKLMELMRRVADGNAQLGPFMFHIRKMARAEEILKHCVSTHRTGNDLEIWMMQYCRGSILLSIQEIIKQIDNEKAARAIVVGRDYFPDR